MSKALSLLAHCQQPKKILMDKSPPKTDGSVKVGVPHDEARRPAVDNGKRYDSTVAGGPCLNCNP